MSIFLSSLVALFIREVLSGIHVSPINEVDCDRIRDPTHWKTETDSHFLAEGESILLSCGICKKCGKLERRCSARTGLEDWTIQRSRYLGYGGAVGGTIEDKPFDLPQIRMRLHERLWTRFGATADPMYSLLRSDYSQPKDEQTESWNESANRPPPLSSNVNLYMAVAKVNQQAKVLRPPRVPSRFSRVMLNTDSVLIRQTRVEDTGVYYCFWMGKRLKEWAITVVKEHDEPFRHVTLPTEYDETTLAFLENVHNGKPLNTSISEVVSGQIESLDAENLVDYNLRLYTDWLPWTQCVPCMFTEQTGYSAEFSPDGFHMRVGICRVRVLDPFLPVRPHSLAILVDETLRAYSNKGLPCRSHLIKEAMQLYGPSALKHRPSEIQHRKCVAACSDDQKGNRIQTYKFPTRVQLRLNEGERTKITCPIRGPIKGPVSWYYSFADPDILVNVTQTAVASETVEEYGSPSAYLMTKVQPVIVSTLHSTTRGRFRLDPGHNLIVAEILAHPPEEENRLHHLICIHGDPRATQETGFSDWTGIIEIQVAPRLFAATVLSKLSQVVLLLIPFILACGTFLIIVLTIHTERKPNMRAAAEGFTNKPPP
ncbi:hypothetical protein PHET_04652 [Paragonimus heterotremus]|uniref:Ig-like domain-containing protein n=1 Tax=Paragonimus heterotremus TaxID=100268 RepID=A0A8J4WHC2_9TREM|nr:hypothetical protein PHET_04652 [Paragonimus heterotremus]